MSTPPPPPASTGHATPKPAANGDGATPGAPAAKSYKDTLNLPKTPFPMKANLVQNEPASMKRWAAMPSGGLYGTLRAARSDGKHAPFRFHDGPPYANGSIHLGHLMNKCLKDFVVRARSMMGMDCPYVPGWDCHGLPIEHKVMTEMVEKGSMDKVAAMPDDQRRMVVRRECRKYAEKFIKLQGGQMQRLLTLADYEHPYLTMDPAYEGATLEVLAEMVEQDLVYRALKPVHWSVANQTALAEAELEYQDREDTSVYVDFEAEDQDAVYDAFGLSRESEEAVEAEADVDSPPPATDAAAAEEDWGPRPTQRPTFMIWTTTPWTLPANVGVAVNPRHDYALARVDGNITVVAAALLEKVAKLARAEEVTVLATAKGEKLLGLRYRHPFVTAPPACGLGRVCDPKKLWSLVGAEYVTLEDGTGLVHTAPGHGADDYTTGLREHLPIYCPVLADGTYDATAPEWLRSVNIWDANKRVVDRLNESGHLFHSHTFTHSYPHDWRSKTPTIFRCTEQWFVSVEGRHEGSATRKSKGEGRNLRKLALEAVSPENHGAVKFVPEWGRNRMRGMLESRPDWCVSRQRAWGLPIPAFVTPDGATVMTAAMVRAVAKSVREKGSDVWFMASPDEVLKHYDEKSDPQLPDMMRSAFAPAARAALKKGADILDVWFESGSSWNAVMRERAMGYPVDLYLEGSDQHRGWFQTSLLAALGGTGVALFKTILTHGFMVDKDGKKMSKSLGNTLEVEDLLKDYGADVSRWWVASLSYENDVKVDKSYFDVAGESYRKVRNTLRFMLSNLDDFTLSGPPAAAAASLDAWVLDEFSRMSHDVVRAYQEYDFRAVHSRLYDFCNDTLSAIYLAAVKDRLYCDRADSPRRRQTQAALWHMTDGLCRLLAPIMPHTADEAFRALWKAGDKDPSRCVHTLDFLPDAVVKADADWAKILTLRPKALTAMEKARAALGVENPLDMGVALPDEGGALREFDTRDLADLLGVSRVTWDNAAAEPRVIDLRSEPRCERSWKRDGTVKKRSDGGMLSDRDSEAVGTT